jgi:hypothetical protein
LVSASLSSEANSAIAKELGYPDARIARENWNGYHVPNEYVEYFELKDVKWGETSGFGYDRANSDKRAFFYNIGGTKEYSNSDINGDVGNLQAVIQKETCSQVMNIPNFHRRTSPLSVWLRCI